MNNSGIQKLSVRNQKKLDSFKEYAVWHPQLAKVDKELMRAIREPAGFTHILVYGPSGVGKTTMMRQITQRLNRMSSPITPPSVTSSQDNLSSLPLLLLETRPPDGGAFNRADYYRTALKLLGEPFYERRMLVNIDSEQVWEKKGRGRTKAAQFNDSPELRHALEEAMSRRGVQAVILDEAQHLMKLGSGSSAGKLLDHAMTLAQCERMALDATEGEQELRYAESRREPLWHLLASGMDASTIPATPGKSGEVSVPTVDAETTNGSGLSKTKRRKRSSKNEASPVETEEKPTSTKDKSRQKAQTPAPVEADVEKPTRKKRPTRSKTQVTPDPSTMEGTNPEVKTTAEESPLTKKRPRRVGQRQPKRDPVGS